jgi:acetyl-CoA carboxylase carboxyltransferase component
MLPDATAPSATPPPDPRLKLSIVRSLVFYLYPSGELALWTEEKFFSFHPSGFSWLARFAAGASLHDLGAELEGIDLAPMLIGHLMREGILAPAAAPTEGHPAPERIQCGEPPPPTDELLAVTQGRLRLARQIFVMFTPSAQLALWVPPANTFREVRPETLTWLREYGRVTTLFDVERVTAPLTPADRALLCELVRAGLVAPLTPPRPRVAAAPSPEQVAHDRITRLVDASSFVEDGRGARGTITGTARVAGRPTVIVAFSPWGDGPLNALQAPIKKILRAQETAARQACPIVYLFGDGGPSEAGPTIDSFLGKESWGRVYHNQAVLSGEVPQVGAIFGRCSMPSSFPTALCDVLILVDGKTFLSIAPPVSVKRWLGAEVDAETLGGARMHCTVSGMGDLLAKSDDEALAQMARVLSYLPSSAGSPMAPTAPRPPAPGARRLEEIIPAHADKPFDILDAIRALVDEDSVLELKRDYAKELTTALARIEGRTVGIVANNSRHRGGILFPESCEKEARFVSLCDAYGIPLLFLMDCPGYMIGANVERGGLLRATGRIYTALVETTVPKITVVVRKAHTGGVYAMCGPFFNPDYFLALPSARIAVLGSKATYEWLAGAEKALPEGRCREDFRDHLDARCRKEMSPVPLASQLAIDALVDFADLRRELASRFAHLAQPASGPRPSGPHKKHAVLQM